MPLQIEGLPAEFEESRDYPQNSESSISIGLGLPPGSYVPPTNRDTSCTKCEDGNNYYADGVDDDDEFIATLREENESLRQQMVNLKMQLAEALSKIDEPAQVNQQLVRDHDTNQPSRGPSSRRSQESMESSAKTNGHFEDAAPQTVPTHINPRQSFRVGGSMSVQSVLTSLRGEADIACIESQQRRSLPCYSRNTGSQSSLSTCTSGFSSTDGASMAASNNESSQWLGSELQDDDNIMAEEDDTESDDISIPSIRMSDRQRRGAQSNSFLRRLSTTLPALIRGESGDSLATDRTNPKRIGESKRLQERKKIANTISPSTLSQFNASTLEFMAAAPSTLAQVRKEQCEYDNGSHREGTKMLSDETYIIPLRIDEEQKECPRIAR